MRDDVGTLVKGAADQTKYTNTLWVTLVVLALFTVVPVSGVSGQRALPFSLGSIPTDWFYLVSTLLLAVFFIAFASAQAQIARAHLLAQQSLDGLVSAWSPGKGLHPRDIFDVTVTPALNRVAPVVQAWRGRYQFYASFAGCPRWLVWLTTAFYVYLKFLAVTIYWVLPGAAMVVSTARFFQSASPVSPMFARPLIYAVLVGTVLSVLPVVWNEFVYILGACRTLTAPPKSEA